MLRLAVRRIGVRGPTRASASAWRERAACPSPTNVQFVSFTSTSTSTPTPANDGTGQASPKPPRKSSIPPKFWKEIKAVHDHDIRDLNARLYGPVDQYNDTVTKLPFVFCLGNHSSGKSSFVNYVLGRKVQNTGVAPTDDSFTIIAPGPDDINQDGNALVGDVEFGFSGLRKFGVQLLNHLSLKVRNDTHLSDVMIIDSPGMIDNPAGRYSGDTEESELQRNMDRGYNFPEVTRWLAVRADVILLFFDPDKPGTTGETLACMTHSLKGMEHKLHIVLNKADQFEKIHDFARAYGALCWNLSKVIPRKDLPRIYTMSLPVDGKTGGGGLGLEDLEEARHAVVEEVMAAPERRLDNTLTWLYDSARLLDMHCTILDALARDWRWENIKHWGIAGSIIASGQGLALGGGYLLAQPEFSIAMAGGSVLLGVGAYLGLAPSKQRRQQELTSEEGLDRIFRRTYHRDIAKKNYFISSLWDRARPCIQTAIETVGVPALRSQLASRSEMARLRDICDIDVPRLRKVVAPHVNKI